MHNHVTSSSNYTGTALDIRQQLSPRQTAAQANLIPWATGLTGLVALFACVWFLQAKFEGRGLVGFVPLHTFLETGSIVASVLVFVVGWNTFLTVRNRNITLLAVAFLCVALVDFLHVLSYQGMPALVTPNDAGKAIYFWLLARLLAAVALLLAAFLTWDTSLAHQPARGWLVAGLVFVGLIAWIGLFHPELIPATFIPGQGLTRFKIAVEFLLFILNLLAAVGFLCQLRQQQVASHQMLTLTLKNLIGASCLLALGELYFTLYVDVTDTINLLGHLHKLAASVFIYRGLVITSLRAPQAALQKEIVERKQAEADALFRVQLGERMRQHGEADTLTREVTRAVGEYLQVQRCFFTEVDLADDRFIIHQDYCDGVPMMTGTYPLSTFNPQLVALTNAGQVAVLHDTATDPRAAEYEAYAELGLGAFIVVPLLREERMVASLAVATTTARDWQPREIALLETVAELTWQVLERLRSEAALQDNEARFASVINSAMDAVISVDDEQRIVLFNPAAEQMFGYTAAEMLGQSLERLLPESARTSHAEHIRGFGATQTTTRTMGALGAISGVRQNGAEFPIEASISQLEANGQKLFTVILRDITRRKEAEAFQAKQMLQSALQRDVNAALVAHETLPEMLRQCASAIVHHFAAAFARIWTLNEDGTVLELQASAGMYTHLNGAHARVPVGQFKIGLIAAERQPHLTNDVQHDSRVGDREWAKREGMEAFAGYPLLSGDRLVGVLALFARHHLTPETLDGLAAIADSIAQGIERQRTRQALKDNEARLQEQAALLNYAQEAIVSCDLEGRILFWNHGAEELYGWMAEEVIGRSLRADLYGDDVAAAEEAREVLFRTGEWSGEHRHYTKDGRRLYIAGHWVVVRDDAGQPHSILIINNDITEKKQLEAQFLRAQRLESIGTLASGIAHDLNNVLSPVLMAVQLLQTRLSDESSQRLLQVLHQNVQRGSEMVKQVLAFARGTSGERLALQPKHLIKDVMAILKETFPKDIVVKYSLPGDLAAVSGDPTQVHQVLMNLCVNARDAMAEHGGTLTITAENKVVDDQFAGMIAGAKAGQYVIITIADTGTGIAPDVLDKIFDPFFTTKAIGSGTGLGLSTVHSIIQSHGGFVNVYSEVGKGTKFDLYLPALTTTQPQPVTTALAELPVGHGEWILVVDDEKAIREITQSTLEAFGYHVLTAVDGTDALAQYANHQHQIRLVLTDMMMPYLDGPATIRALQKLNPAVAIIASSGLSEGEKAQEAAALGVQTILAKPYTAADLLQALSQALK